MLIAKWRVRPQWKATRSFASLCLLLLLLLRLLPGKYMKIVLTLDKRHKRHKVKRALGASSCLPFPSFLPCFLPSFASAASAVIDATINLTSCSRRQLRNSQPLGGHLTTLITFARSHFAQLFEWEITHSRSQSDLVRHKGCSSFFCLCPSTISFVAAVCRQHAATSCHWTAKSGGESDYIIEEEYRSNKEVFQLPTMTTECHHHHPRRWGRWGVPAPCLTSWQGVPYTLPLSCFLSTSTSPPLFLAFSLLKVLPGTQFVLCCYDTKNAYVVLASAYRGRQFNKWPILLLRLISNQHIPRQQTGTQTNIQYIFC